MKTTFTQQAFAPLSKIPSGKKWRKVAHSLAGTVVFVGAFFLPKVGFPWQASLVVAAFGGWIASKELLLGFLKIIPAFLKDIKSAWKNGA